MIVCVYSRATRVDQIEHSPLTLRQRSRKRIDKGQMARQRLASHKIAFRFNLDVGHFQAEIIDNVILWEGEREVKERNLARMVLPDNRSPVRWP